MCRRDDYPPYDIEYPPPEEPKNCLSCGEEIAIDDSRSIDGLYHYSCLDRVAEESFEKKFERD